MRFTKVNDVYELYVVLQGTKPIFSASSIEEVNMWLDVFKIDRNDLSCLYIKDDGVSRGVSVWPLKNQNDLSVN